MLTSVAARPSRLAEQVAQLGEAAMDRDGDHHPPDDRHQERLGDREAPEGEQQEQADPDDDLGRGARDGEVAALACRLLHGPGPRNIDRLRAGGGQTPCRGQGPLRAHVVAGGA